MAQGWEELRLITDGRWQPTGQLTDAFPFRSQVGDFHTADVIDTNNAARHVFLKGTMPLTEPVGALGWAHFIRN